MDYNHRKIESRWQQYWKDNKVYHTEIDHGKPKFYVLEASQRFQRASPDGI